MNMGIIFFLLSIGIAGMCGAIIWLIALPEIRGRNVLGKAWGISAIFILPVACLGLVMTSLDIVEHEAKSAEWEQCIAETRGKSSSEVLECFDLRYK